MALVEDEFVRKGVCLSCGGAVLHGSHIEEDRHMEWTASRTELEELRREVANLRQPYRWRVDILDNGTVWSSRKFKAKGGYTQGRKFADRWVARVPHYVVEFYAWDEIKLTWERTTP